MVAQVGIHPQTHLNARHVGQDLSNPSGMLQAEVVSGSGDDSLGLAIRRPGEDLQPPAG